MVISAHCRHDLSAMYKFLVSTTQAVTSDNTEVPNLGLFNTL